MKGKKDTEKNEHKFVKDKRKKWKDYLLIGVAVFSFVLAMLEGCFYYFDDYGDDLLIYVMLTLQNSIKAFSFKTTITLENAYEQIHAGASAFEKIIGYLYCGIYFVAPFCTAAVVFKIIERLLRFRRWFFNGKNQERVLIFGHNEYVDKILAEVNNEKPYRKIHLITTDDIEHEKEVELLKKNVKVHHFDCINANEKTRRFYMKEIEAERARLIVLFEEKASTNFSLYHMFQERDECKLSENVKFFCYCDDYGIENVIMNYHDEKLEEQRKVKEPLLSDIEVFNVHMLQVQEMFRAHPLHSYYQRMGDRPKLSHWDVHMLILGFGGLGQQILLETMNQGVIHSKNEILIDVVDFKIEEKMSIFANHFSSGYVTMDEHEMCIPAEQADGTLRIRYHKMDMRYKKFQNLLEEMGREKPFTYITICMDDTSVCVHSMQVINNYLREQSKNNVPVGIRMDTDVQLAEYFASKKDENFFVIDSPKKVISLDKMLGKVTEGESEKDIDLEAKRFNYIYENLILAEGVANPKKNTVKSDNMFDFWIKTKLFKRDSNRALSLHQDIKMISINELSKEYFRHKPKKIKKILKPYFNENESKCIMYKENGAWYYNSEEELLEQLKKDPFLKEMARIEHRRWCYHMSTHGWRYNQTKNEGLRYHDCMCNWENLVKNKSDKCKYDLMPLLAMMEDAK